ncbi:MAG TPA: hypothetical protein VK505_10875 [Steroidobacteraceae bacterium]|nr:hypothetical protein [Steroidobacteraceae bacterium]
MDRTLWGLLAVLCITCPAPPARATGQAPDIIEIDGKEADLNTNPLAPYLSAHPEQRPTSDVVSSGLWRGYIAHWQIAEGALRLVKVEVLAGGGSSGGEDMKDVTAQYFPQAPLVATWYSGALIIPRGELVNYVHMGYASTYEAYTVVVVKNGIVAKRDELPLAQFEAYRRLKFDEFKSTKLYAAEFKRARKQMKSSTMAEQFLFEFYAEQYLSSIEQPK